MSTKSYLTVSELLFAKLCLRLGGLVFPPTSSEKLFCEWDLEQRALRGADRPPDLE